MSSLAQDELGHAAALYGLLGDAHRRRPRRARLRPRARRVPPLPAARPRPRRLGDDDRPALPVRHRRRRPARCAGRRVVGAARRARREARPRGALSPDARRGLARRAWRGATASRASGCWPRSRRWAPMPRPCSRRSPDEPALVEAGILAAPMAELEARWRASIAPDARRRPACPMPPPARDPTRGRLDHGDAVPLAVGRVHDRSAARTPERPGERGRDPDRHRAAAGRRDSADAGRSDDADRRCRRPRRRPPRAGRGHGPGAPDAVRSSTSGSSIGVEVDAGDGSIRVEILPTFVGCPALELIKTADRGPARRVRPAGRGDGDLRGAVDIRADQRRRTRRPAGGRDRAADGRDRTGAADAHRPRARVPCPHCGSRRTTLDNVFGPTQCRTIRYCRDCRQPFEAIKPV